MGDGEDRGPLSSQEVCLETLEIKDEGECGGGNNGKMEVSAVVSKKGEGECSGEQEERLGR